MKRAAGAYRPGPRRGRLRGPQKPRAAPAVARRRARPLVIEGVDRVLEVGEHREDLRVRERKHLRQEHAGDAGGGINPEVGVVQTGPRQTPGGTPARLVIEIDQEPETEAAPTIGGRPEVVRPLGQGGDDAAGMKRSDMRCRPS